MWQGAEVNRLSKIVLCLTLPVLVCTLPGASRAADGAAPLVLERTIPLAGVSGRIDHMAIDLARQRLFVAELGNGTVDAIDLVAGKAMHRIEGLREPQGIGYAPKADVIAVASAGDGSVRLYRAEDFAPLGIVDLTDDADNIRLDPNSGLLIVGYGAGGLAVLDPASRSIVARVKLPVHPESFQLDPAGRRAFVNLPNAHKIAVIDLANGSQLATWRVPSLSANFPMAHDTHSATVAVVFRNPARLVLLDAGSGAVTMNSETCRDADDVFFDPKRRRIYVSCGEGSVDVFQQDASSYRSLGRIKTAAGARTSLFVPELDRLFVAARAGLFGLGSDATILVFRPEP
jgi:DNA-binding beta-propeller fold protein YncE